jgi:cytochrome P450
VRINPRELHIKDPYYFDTIYTSKKQEKDPYIVRAFTTPLSTAATVDHDHHHFRRELVNPFFSKRSVMGLESIVQDKVEKITQRLKQAHKEGTVVSLDGLFAALTADVISHYTYGESMGILDTEGLRNDFRDAVAGAGVLCHFSRFFALVGVLLEAVPSFIEWMQPKSKGLFDAKRMVEEKVMFALNNENDNTKDTWPRKTIFDSLCNKSLPPQERTLQRVRDEALVVLGAGTETTARVLTVGSFYLYRDRSMLQKLRDELKQVMPEPTSKIPLPQLEKLPYLVRIFHPSRKY